jgi:hypothetical protein
VGGQIRPEPAFLLGTLAAGHLRAVAVEDDDVPLAEVVAVPTLSSRPRPSPEVVEVTGGAGRPVLVVADRRVGPSLEPTPCRAIAVGELCRAAVVVDVISQRRHGPQRRGDERGRCGIAEMAATGDVPGRDKNRIDRLRRRDTHQAIPGESQGGDEGRGAARRKRCRPQQIPHTAHKYDSDFQRRVSGSGEIIGMESRIRDAFLIAIVVTALVMTGAAFFDLGRRLPPPPEVRPTPAPQVVPAPSEQPEY